MKVSLKKVLLFVESMLQDVKQLQHEQFYYYFSGLKIIDHGNTDNNLESHCIRVSSNYILKERLILTYVV
jgi:hypothetical protein